MKALVLCALSSYFRPQFKTAIPTASVKVSSEAIGKLCFLSRIYDLPENLKGFFDLRLGLKTYLFMPRNSVTAVELERG